MTSTQLNPLGKLLLDSLNQIDRYEAEALANREKDTIHIPTVGSTISTAYEQLRNASEYSEGDFLQQRAIRRYLNRALSFHTQVSTSKLAGELVAELTQAEYLKNDETTKTDVKQLARHIKTYYEAYWQYAQMEPDSDKRAKFQHWVLDVLAVRCEQVLRSNVRQLMFAHFAVQYLYEKISYRKLTRHDEGLDINDTPLVIYIAIHRALLKSEDAIIRAALIDSYQQDVSNIENFESFNRRVDMLLECKATVTATRIVSKNGAALRFIYTGFYQKDAPITTQSLKSPEALEQSLHRHIDDGYDRLDKRLNSGIIKSIIFLLITKGIIGFSVEVPYDYLIYNEILWTPFIINLLFPAVFIALTRLTLSRPSERNTAAIIRQTETMLFEDPKTIVVKTPKDTSSLGFNLVYAFVFIIVFALLSWRLYLFHFNIVQGMIFFIFLSTAAFLAFRLSRQIHELEAVNTSQGSLSLMRDIMYMPFIYVGRQISYRYSKINIVAIVLDILIEMPLKTILRLVRQWNQFLNAKKDELI
ncbi:hypothetical protein KC949_02955 [Candidatus Saccharibacteria bacterium]|nr:hypothetical protein [Candidatus Saccharibacteria bacterium]